jgi:hypothetical protein
MTLTERAADGASTIAARNIDLNGQTWVHWMKRNIRMLWDEEGHVATVVGQAVCNGEQF